MAPDETKRALKGILDSLEMRAARGDINYSDIASLIEAHARIAARHNGVPELWRSYLPEQEI